MNLNMNNDKLLFLMINYYFSIINFSIEIQIFNTHIFLHHNAMKFIFYIVSDYYNFLIFSILKIILYHEIIFTNIV